VSLPTSGRKFLEALSLGNPRAAAGAGANVVCRDLVGGAGWGHVLNHQDIPCSEELEKKQVLKCARVCEITVVAQGTQHGQ